MTKKETPEKLYFTTKLAYGAGDLGPAITANILVFFLLPFFTNIAGLSPGLAGSILMIGKVSDAINDPIIGILSDHTRTKWGRRLPWIVFGAIPFGLGFFLQWIVPHFSDNEQINTWALFIYYIFIGILFNIFYTAVSLPYQALTPELTRDYNERTNLNSFRFTFSIGGSILSLILAGVIFNIYAGDDTKKFLMLGLVCTLLSVIAIFWCAFRIQERGAEPIFNHQQKKVIGFLLIGLAVVLMLVSLSNLFAGGIAAKSTFIALMNLIISVLLAIIAFTLIASKTEPHLRNKEANKLREIADSYPALNFVQQLKIVFSNQPFLFVIGIYLCSWLAVQLTASILLYFVVNWMALPQEAFPSVAIAVQGTALIMLFFWQAVSNRLDKRIVYFLGTIIWIVAEIGLFLVQPRQTILLYALAILAGCGVSVAYLIPWSMVPDVIELDELQTGQRREGIFYGFMVLLQKFGLALGLFLVGVVLEAAGFIKSVAGQPIATQPESALLAIRIVVAPLPALVLIMGLVLAYFYPITREYHAQIRLQLQQKHLPSNPQPPTTDN
jgi:GPH family glycoside/pentoside/hexuronide:cation symporter